ncbi:MAG: GatB/YqeY domain-containing protein [Candidatus Omnitrophica bacterium]|nr:GatB/YqeY domain-containing protein [Candidatus Omnitrophota bacterium]
MSLSERISEDLKAAMKAKDEVRLRTVRSIRAEILKKEKEGKGAPTDEQIIQAISRLVNQHRESIEQFTKGGRQDLVDSESAELAILEEYLPASLSNEEVERIVVETLQELGIASPRDMGKAMGAVMQRLKQTGKLFEGGMVNQLVKSRLSAS